MFSVSNNFNICKNVTFNASFEYQSEGDDGISRVMASYNLSASLLWRLFKDKLQLGVSANDLLGTVNNSSWEDRYKNIVTGLKSRLDSRYVRLEVRFNFNKLRNEIKNRANNSDELNRIR